MKCTTRKEMPFGRKGKSSIYAIELCAVVTFFFFIYFFCRNDCLVDLPQGLPCLLHCVEWNDRDEVSEMRSLLNKWPPLSEERALELLDYAYADSSVRRFAVNCLKKLK